MRWGLVLPALVAVAQSASVTPANWTAATLAQRVSHTDSLTVTDSGLQLPLINVPLSIPTPFPSDASGLMFLANTTNYLQIASMSRNTENDFAILISCDPQPGLIQASDILQIAVDYDNVAILFSEQSDYCDMSGSATDDGSVFSTWNAQNTSVLLFQLHGAAIGPNVYIEMGTTSTGKIVPQHSSGTFGNSATTYILYAVTGIIAILFLAIVVTGAIRVRRNPERYGPRVVQGRVTQSRAKGLAKAMLESLPIVKFGDPDGNVPKATDIELSENIPEDTNKMRLTAVENDSIEATETTVADPVPSSESNPPANIRESTESGIVAAFNPSGAAREANPAKSHHAECAICADEFEAGQDQRVLPCDHRFHPACIDPWLLNISGTCPLCRIDLRPQDDEANDPATAGDLVDSMASPLAVTTGSQGDQSRLGVRRAIMLGLMGAGRPEFVSREERLVAQRQLRHQETARQQQEREAAVEQTAEEQNQDRRRLRNLLRRPRDTSSAAADGAPSLAPVEPR